jgi:hypothetical protein
MKKFLKSLFKNLFIFIGGLARNTVAFAVGVAAVLLIIFARMYAIPFSELLIPVMLIVIGIAVGRMNKTVEVVSTISGFVLTYIFIIS